MLQSVITKQKNKKMQYQLKDLSRCDSQQLPAANLSTYSQKTETFSHPSVNSQLSQLLAKIQAINNDKITTSNEIHNNNTSDINKSRNSSKNNKNNLDFQPPNTSTNYKLTPRQKQGKTEDQPHRPQVLNMGSSRHRRSSRLSPIAGVRGEEGEKVRQIQSRVEKEIVGVDGSGERERDSYYKYYTEQMARVSAQNATLQKNLQKTLQQLSHHKKISQTLQTQNLSLQHQLAQLQNTTHSTTQQLLTLKTHLQAQQSKNQAQQQQQLQRQRDTKIFENQILKYRKLLHEKDEENSQLVAELQSLRREKIGNFETEEENRKLGRIITELMEENKGLRKRIMVKTEAVDCLWGIKEIEYGNIVELISLGRQQNQ